MNAAIVRNEQQHDAQCAAHGVTANIRGARTGTAQEAGYLVLFNRFTYINNDFFHYKVERTWPGSTFWVVLCLSPRTHPHRVHRSKSIFKNNFTQSRLIWLTN